MPKRNYPNNKDVPHRYAKAIQSGKIKSSEWTKLGAKRYFDDIDRALASDPKFPYRFNKEDAYNSLEYFDFLHHSKGEWAGEVFELEPWQQFLLWNIFGWKHKDTMYRRFRTCYLEVARKNGKTTKAAGVGLYLFDGDGEPGAEVYSAATKFDQAKICHGEATRMVKSSAHLRSRIKNHVNNLYSIDTNSIFRPVGRDHDTLDGLNIHGAIVDELHAHKTRDMWDVIETATASRRQPLIFVITTAGFNKQTICYELHNYSQKILERSMEPVDETFLAMIYTLDKDDDWENEKNWVKANPNLHISTKVDDLRRKALKAKEIPSALNTFLRLHMNIWTESETRWIPADTWMTCNSPVILDNLKGRTCYGGLDLSSNKDLSAFVLCFPPLTENDKYIILPRLFVPEDNIQARVKNDRVPYDAWIEQGFIIPTPGNVINYDIIKRQISEDSEIFDIPEIAFDRWGATKIVQDLAELGFEKPADNKHAHRFLIDFGQGYMSMNAPMKELENLILSKMIAHGGDPVLAWMCSNVVVSEDAAGNVKPDKGKSTEKIDGIVATIMALDRAIKQEFSLRAPPPPIFI